MGSTLIIMIAQKDELLRREENFCQRIEEMIGTGEPEKKEESELFSGSRRVGIIR
jgi:hypothetical protein